MILAFALATALAQNPTGNPTPSFRAWRDAQGWRSSRATGRSGTSPAFFEFAPPSGSGLPAVTPICDTLQSGEKVGSWFCQQGDGSMASGSTITLSATGSPTQISQRVCPNGPDCAAVTARQPISASSGYNEGADVDRSASVTTGGFTQCWHGVVQASAVEQELMGLASSGSTPWRSMPFIIGGGTEFRAYIAAGACPAAVQVGSGLNVTFGAPHLICLTWAASDGIFRTYLDGVAGGVSASYTTICGGGPTSRYTTLGYWSAAQSSAPTGGFQIGAFDTSTQLSAARIAAIARAVLADTPTGSKGEALSTSRASPTYCPSSNGSGSMLPPGRMCIRNGGIRADATRENVLVRSIEIENAGWLSTTGGGAAAAIRTANQAIAPDGTFTADRVQFPATSAATNQFSWLYQGPFGVTQKAGSVWLKGNGTSGSINLAMGSTPGYCRTCSFNPTAWTWCFGEFVGADYFFIGNDSFGGASACGAVDRAAADVFVWGGQMELGTTPSGHIVTGVAAVTRNQDVIDALVNFSPTAGYCQAATMEYYDVTKLGAGAGTTGVMLTTGATGAAITATYTWPFSGFAGGYSAIDSLGVMSAGSASWNPGITLPTNTTRYLYRHPGGVGNWTACTNGTCQTQGATSTWGTPAFTRIKLDRATAAAGNDPQHTISNIQVDFNSSRCTP